jgi:hypothetical protein
MRRLAIVGSLAISVSLIVVCGIGHRVTFLDRGPTPDEFATYATFLSRLSADGTGDVAIAQTTAKLVANKAESWIPPQLQPYPPDKQAPALEFIEFCGSVCGHDFMHKNLRSWQLKPSSETQFPFTVIPANLESSLSAKRIVKVSRTGFDLWHRRAAFSYSFDCSTGGTPGQPAILCVQIGDVLLKKANGKWQVVRYSAMLL